MKFRRVAILIGVGSVLIGCGEPMPSIGEAKDVPAPSQSPTVETKVAVSNRVVSFTATQTTQSQDFLFVFDDSGSMTEEVDTVQAQLSSFFSSLNARRNVDYRVAVTTTNVVLDQGGLYQGSGGHSVLSPSTPNVLNEFSSILSSIKVNIANASSRPWGGLEMGWLAAERAISNHGYRFMRDGVPLAVVILSDATDSSRRCYSTSNGIRCENDPYPVSRFVTFFKTLTSPNGTATKALLYPLAARNGSDCNGLEGTEAEWDTLGGRYQEVQSQVGTGFSGSICGSALANNLNEIGRRISNRGICYDLSGGATAVLEVSVSGTRVSASASDGYQFDASTGSVCFAGSYQPPAGQTITVIYQSPN